MKLICKYIAVNVRERKLRTAVMLSSILLSSMLLFVSCSIGASYERAQQKMAKGMAGSAAVSVAAAGGGLLSEEKLVLDLPLAEAYVGILKSPALYHEDGYYESVDCIAADPAGLSKINEPRMADGGIFTGLSGNEVILPDRFTSQYGIQKGDDITLQIAGRPVVLHVADIAAYDTLFLRHTRGVTALLSVDTLSALLGRGNGYSEILIQPAIGADADRLAAQLREVLSEEEYRISVIVDEAQMKADARQKSMPFFLISFFSLTMSVCIIYSSYKVITLERLPVMGTFRSIGATKRDVIKILMLESLIYGSVGGIMGIPAGMAVLSLILQGMGKNLAQSIEIVPVISVPGMIAALTEAVLTSLLSACLPVFGVSRLPVRDIVLGKSEERRMTHGWAACAGFLLLLLLLSAAVPEIADGTMLYLAGGCSLAGMIGGALLILPYAVQLISKGLEHVYQKMFGNEGWLAARNMRENKTVIQNITLMFISISAVIVISVVGDFVTAYVGDVFRDAQMNGFADGRMDQAFVKQVESIEGVEQVLPLQVLSQEAAVDGIVLNRMEATDDLNRYSSLLDVSLFEEQIQGGAAAVFARGRYILLSEAFIKQTHAGVGDSVMLTSGELKQSYTIAGTFQSRVTDTDAVIPSICAEEDFQKNDYGFLAYTAADPQAVMIQIRTLFGDTPNWSRTVEEFHTDALRTVGAFLAPMHAMTYFILLLAAVGVVNQQLIQYIQKRRTIAMYQCAGMSRRQNMKITLIESFTAGLVGASAAILVSAFEIRTIFLVAGPKISMVPKLDAGIFLTAGIMGIAVTLAGSVVPILKSGRMKLVEELKSE